jgi:hypothetical protein
VSTRRRGVIGAVAVVTVLVTGCGGDGDGDGESAPPAASSPTGSASTASAGPIEWVDALPIGPPPRIGYVIGHTYHSPDGGIVQLPRDRGYTAIAPLGDGFLAVDDRIFEATVGILRLDSRGRRVGVERYVAGAPVISGDGRTLRWITFTPSEFGPERQPTLLHVADIATGEVRSRRIGPPHEIRPAVRQRAGIPEVLVRDNVVIVRDRVTHVQVARLAAPGPWVRAKIRSSAWEDRAHLLVSFQQGGRVAILRVDVRSGGWSLAVDWTPLRRISVVAFETVR